MHFSLALFVFVAVFLQLSIQSPFLYNPSAIPALISSASAASSSSQTSSEALKTNIADLRAKKTEQLQEEKEGPVEEDEFSAEEETNEAAPSLLQKKVSKIIAKLRFLARLSNLGSSNNNNNNNDDDFEKEQDEFDKEFEDENYEKTNVTLLVNQKSTEKTEISEDAPNRVTIEVNTDKIKRQAPRGNLSLNPGDVGVFFMEVLGSIVGLAYGALAQVNQPNNGPRL